jgi:YVTN family beta-propeller protein
MRSAALFCACLIAFGQAPPRTQVPYAQTVVQNGTRVTVNVEHVDSAKAVTDPLHEFENVVVQVRIVDVATGSPRAGGSPAAWIDRRPGTGPTTPEQCTGKVKRFAEGTTFSRAELDLTSYVVVILNSDPTLAVVDPRFGYGDTRLLSMVPLDGPGEDWVLTGDGRRLFVTVPAANEVVAVDTEAWKVISTAASVPRAATAALQPDEGYLWVAYGGNDEDSGVVALNVRDMKPAARIRTGRGYHHVTFSADSSFAFVTNPQDGTVSVIDVRRLSKVSDVRVGDKPTWITYSDLAKAAYVANEGDNDERCPRIRADPVRSRRSIRLGRESRERLHLYSRCGLESNRAAR